jgi:hypothetical protein
LNKDSPASRAVESFGRILPVPILGGLHPPIRQDLVSERDRLCLEWLGQPWERKNASVIAPSSFRVTAILVRVVGVPMQIREYSNLIDKHSHRPYFYMRWFCCMNKNCRTTLVMPERYKIMNPVMLTDE